jgi:hypothetical protein
MPARNQTVLGRNASMITKSGPAYRVLRYDDGDGAEPRRAHYVEFALHGRSAGPYDSFQRVI